MQFKIVDQLYFSAIHRRTIRHRRGLTETQASGRGYRHTRGFFTMRVPVAHGSQVFVSCERFDTHFTTLRRRPGRTGNEVAFTHVMRKLCLV